MKPLQHSISRQDEVFRSLNLIWICFPSLEFGSSEHHYWNNKYFIIWASTAFISECSRIEWNEILISEKVFNSPSYKHSKQSISCSNSIWYHQSRCSFTSVLLVGIGVILSIVTRNWLKSVTLGYKSFRRIFKILPEKFWISKFDWKARGMFSNATTPTWVPDAEQTNCSQCNDIFTMIRRKHHCRVCGRLFCAECSAFKLLIPSNRLLGNPMKKSNPDEPQRSCSHCAR